MECPAHNILYDLNPIQVLSAAHTAHSDTFDTQYFSRARAQCPLVITSLKREKSTSHGQISLCKCKGGQKVLEGKFCRAPLNLMHPDCYQQLLRGVCSHTTDFARHGLGKIHTVPSSRSAFEAINCQWWVKHSTKLDLDKDIPCACLLWLTLVLFQTIICFPSTVKNHFPAQ